ncbi:MAG TPA: winged helix-turn-helix domain-containing protein [Thermoplasmata archaeon]|nr:winged helix-turn-helix domain-containing protein [Thermoplasmata archaeon]
MELRPSRRRERTDLYAEILEVIKRYRGQGRVTRVSYAVGMPVDRLNTALAKLLDLGLIRTTSVADVTLYDLTPRGQQFLDTYWRMRAFTELFDRDGPPGPPEMRPG